MYDAVIVGRVPAVKAHTEDLATTLVDVAGEILSGEGPAALTLRRLARAADTSTMAVYTLFGDKTGLLGAMHRAGFERLTAALERARSSDADPLAALAAQGIAYRRVALANPHLYGLMFGYLVPGFTPRAADKTAADEAFGSLIEGVAACLKAGVVGGADARRIAFHLWAVSHGMVTLEIAGQLPGGQRARSLAYQESLIFSVAAFLSQPEN